MPAKREGIAARQVDLARQRNIAVERAREAPVHQEVAVEVLPAVAGADEAAGGLREAGIGGEGEMRRALPRDEDLAVGNLQPLARVAAPAPSRCGASSA